MTLATIGFFVGVGIGSSLKKLQNAVSAITVFVMHYDEIKAKINKIVLTTFTAVIAISISKYQKYSEKHNNEYTVYYLKDDDVIRYVGRVKKANLVARLNYHKRKRGLKIAFYISDLNYAECRAIEQAGIGYFNTLGNTNAIN